MTTINNKRHRATNEDSSLRGLHFARLKKEFIDMVYSFFYIQMISYLYNSWLVSFKRGSMSSLFLFAFLNSVLYIHTLFINDSVLN